MTLSALAEAVTTRFRTVVAEPASMTLLKDNDPEPTLTAAPTSWCRMKGRASGSQQVSTGPVGSRRFRTSGSITFEIGVPAKRGSELIGSLSDQCVACFRGLVLADPNVRFEPAPYAGEITVGPDGWCRRIVHAPFLMDEFS